jgi:DNA polymerase III delta prime subunit
MSNRKNLINFYELDEMKEFMPTINDTQKEHTGMPLSQHFLLCGSTGSGKTNTLLNYLRETSRNGGVFTKIFMCVQKLEEPNRFLKSKLSDEFLTMVFDVKDVPDVREFPDLSKHNNKQWLIIFDDCITESDKNKKKKILDFFVFGRSKGCTVVYLSQSYFQTPIFIRKQMSFVLLCSAKAKDRKRILSDIASGDEEPEVLEKMYEFAKEDENPRTPSFLKICTYECPKDKKYSRNFIEYLDPKDFGG